MDLIKPLVIMVDCDDVLVDSTRYSVDVYNKKYGTNIPLERAHLLQYKDWGGERELVLKRIVELQNTDEFNNLPPRRDALEVVARLGKEHELHLVTARAPEAEKTTLRMLEQFPANLFKSIHHIGSDKLKGEVCKELGADVMVDDNLKHVISAYENGIKLPIWFGCYPWQDEDKNNICNVRCADWYEVERELDKAVESLRGIT